MVSKGTAKPDAGEKEHHRKFPGEGDVLTQREGKVGVMG